MNVIAAALLTWFLLPHIERALYLLGRLCWEVTHA
jgi:hypothetical protein